MLTNYIYISAPDPVQTIQVVALAGYCMIHVDERLLYQSIDYLHWQRVGLIWRKINKHRQVKSFQANIWLISEHKHGLPVCHHNNSYHVLCSGGVAAFYWPLFSLAVSCSDWIYLPGYGLAVPTVLSIASQWLPCSVTVSLGSTKCCLIPLVYVTETKMNQ